MSRQAPQKISKATEQKLLGYLDKVATHINNGDSPNGAIVKVARDCDVELGHVKLLAQAYNNARTNQQRKSSNELTEKIASFPIADIKEITKELYPEHIKTAAETENEGGVSDEYSRRPEIKMAVKIDINPKFEKAASWCVPTEPARNVKKAWSLLKELNTQYEEKRRLLSASHDKVASAYDDLVYHFKQAYHPVSQAEARFNAEAFWGRPAKILMDHLMLDVAGPNRGGDKFASAMDRTKAPYNLIERCLKLIEKHAKLKDDFRTFAKEADIASERLVSKFVPVAPQRTYGSIVKKADIAEHFTKQVADTPVLSPLTESLTKGLGKPDAKLKTDAFMSVTDPAHESKLRGIRSQAMLSDMMSNDPFLSGESPEKVLGLYNQITKLSPRASDQPLLMRALLRRYLAQGQVDPHDIDQLAGIEVKLKQRDEPQREYNLPKLPTDLTQVGGGGRSKPIEE